MDKYLERLGYDFLTTIITIPAGLEDIVNREFLVENDCILLLGWYGHYSIMPFDTELEKSIHEDNETHFHPDTYIPEGNDEIEYLAYALESARRLAIRLQNEFPDRNFRLIVSFSETTYEKDNSGEIDGYGNSRISFHQIRPSAEHVMRHDDLNSFKADAVLEIEL